VERLLIGAVQFKTCPVPLTPNARWIEIMKRQALLGRWNLLRRYKVILAVTLGIILTPAVPSNAAALPPGTSLYPVPAGIVPGGTTLAGGLPVSFSSGAFSGTLTSTVLQNDPTNTLGGLTFEYVLQDLAASPGPIQGIYVGSFAGLTVDVDYVTDTNSVPPAYVSRTDSGGSSISAFFAGPPLGAGPLSPGESSELVIYTNSHVYAAALATITDGGAQVATYATPALVGDTNFDGVVNGLDIGLVASNWLQVGNNHAGDANFDGVVNGLDISRIAGNWLHSAGGIASSSVGVPEPSAFLLAVFGGLATLAWQCRRFS
jgi:Dockerin type I domain